MVPLTEVVPLLFLFPHSKQGASPIWSESYTLLIEDPIVLLLTHIDLVNGIQDGTPLFDLEIILAQ
jgi:hypothetical protein